jgi:hypothetical protein
LLLTNAAIRDEIWQRLLEARAWELMVRSLSGELPCSRFVLLFSVVLLCECS